MTGSAVHTFDDPHPYQAAIRAADLEVFPTAKGTFRAELTHIDLNKLWMQHCQENLPRIFRGAVKRHRAPIGFLVSDDHPAIRHCGMAVSSGDIIVNDGRSMHRRTFSPTCWGSMSLAPEDLAAAGRAIAGVELTVPSQTYVARPDAADMQRMLTAYQEAVALARTAPDRLSHPEVARAIEQTLVHAMVTCLTAGTRFAMSAGDRRHSAAMVRFEDFLDANAERPLYIGEVCAASGVSERTLRASCQDHLGMSPVRYLWLRRMHLVRRKLIMAAPQAATVTEIATEHGFWELGRFSVQYRSLFGELPSSTLRKPGRL